MGESDVPTKHGGTTAATLSRRLLAAPRRVDRARSDAEREWERLSAEVREGLPSPDALTDVG
jgi:hypothetical protein